MSRYLIALALLLAMPAQADGMQDSIEACKQLNDGPQFVTCEFRLVRDLPVFQFIGLPGMDKDAAVMSIAGVVIPMCLMTQVAVVLAGYDGEKIFAVQMALCESGVMSEFKPVDVPADAHVVN
jgi:hypothetical protein